MRGRNAPGSHRTFDDFLVQRAGEKKVAPLGVAGRKNTSVLVF